jgi:PAS domain S-box-containing protein
VDQEGKISHYRGFVIDISKYKHAKEELRKNKERISLAMEDSRDGIWDWNVQTDDVLYSPNYVTMLGYRSQELISNISFWKNHIHPDDINEVLRINQACIENECDTFQVVFRMQTKSLDWCWILGRGKAVSRDAHGRAMRMVGTHTDITQWVQAEEQRERLQPAICVVEDNEMVLELVVETLKELGYKVLWASNGSQCLERIREYIGSLDMLLADVVLPDTNGKVLYEQVKLIFPGIRVLYMSGYAEQVITQSGMLGADVNFIQKPFTLQDLNRKIQMVLEGG